MYKINAFIKSQILFFMLSLFTFSFIVAGCSSDEQSAGGQFSMPPMPVEAAKVKQQEVSDMFEAVGTIQAIEEVIVVSEIDGAVKKLPFDEGGYINKGGLIAQLDDMQLGAEVTRTEALHNQMQQIYERTKLIVEQKAGSQQTLDDALANLKVAEANFALAKARFNKTRIEAPFSGVIGSRKVSVGTFLRTGDAIAELANLNEIRVSFSAPERYLAQLKRGSEVIVSSPVFPGHKVSGRIIAIEPVLNSETRTAQIVARVQNPGQKFRPGMSANISAVLNQRTDALTIPNESVFASGNQSFVFVIKEDSTVTRVPVTLGLQLSDVVEVVEGVEKGMQIVTAGHQKLFEGAKVMPIVKDNVTSTK